mmetsp:Transcript_34431/g.90871  ORF Transcript_34431/g.90871 Transcript_34431/m.90871 type:complete len:285 (-) Transcript_34431:230-1084(-)
MYFHRRVALGTAVLGDFLTLAAVGAAASEAVVASPTSWASRPLKTSWPRSCEGSCKAPSARRASLTSPTEAMSSALPCSSFSSSRLMKGTASLGEEGLQTRRQSPSGLLAMRLSCSAMTVWRRAPALVGVRCNADSAGPLRLLGRGRRGFDTAACASAAATATAASASASAASKSRASEGERASPCFNSATPSKCSGETGSSFTSCFTARSCCKSSSSHGAAAGVAWRWCLCCCVCCLALEAPRPCWLATSTSSMLSRNFHGGRRCRRARGEEGVVESTPAPRP